MAERTQDRKQLIFTAFDPLQGRGRELARFDTNLTPDAEYAWDLSPDGSRITILKRSEATIHCLSLSGQASRQIVVKGWSGLQSVDWAAGGSGLFVSSVREGGSALLRLNLKGNGQLLWAFKGTVAPGITAFVGGPLAPWAVPSPDGRPLAIYGWTLNAIHVYLAWSGRLGNSCAFSCSSSRRLSELTECCNHLLGMYVDFQYPLGIRRTSMPPIKHVFVLMLENRSFDHLLGMSPFTGIDAVTQRPTQINALPAGVSNSWNGANYPAGPPAVDPIKNDPYHEFEDVLEQLCGAAVKYPKGGPYPAINNSGFVSNFAVAAKSPSPGDVMKCFTPERLPVLSALARTYAVCDSWFCSLPGPTWPNRFFALGASSGDLDHSPTTPETEVWETVDGFQFQNGSIFDVKGLSWRIYAGNKIFTLAHALKGIHIWDIRRYAKFAKDISDPSYPAQFTWIEPNYGHVTTDYLKGNSQHPLDGVTGGEALIKATYQAIRNSPLWESSMFIITWDEHGGFYDHVAPAGGAVEPGDQPAFPGANRYGFRFDQYGPRVPAVVISPLIPANTIDHRPYDHSSILATVERMFKLNPLTRRDRAALDPSGLASLAVPRDVPNVFGEVPPEALAAHQQVRLDGLQDEMPAATRPEAPVDEQPNLPGFIFVASQTDRELQLTEVAREVHHAAVRERVARIRTKGDARDYFEEVRRKAVAAEPEL